MLPSIIQKGHKRLRANVELPAGLVMDNTDQINVAKEHTYCNILIEDSSSEEDEESEPDKQVEPILNIGGGIFYEGDISEELRVAQEEVICIDDEEISNFSQEEHSDEDSGDLTGDDEHDSPYLCSSQHSGDGAASSQECSQVSDPGNFIKVMKNFRLYMRLWIGRRLIISCSLGKTRT